MAQLGIWNSKGGVVLNKYLVARIFAFDDHESEARADARVAFYDVATGARKLRPKQPRRPALPDQFAALSLSFQIGGPSTRRKRASAKFSPRATSRAAVVTPDDKETAPAPFSAELTAGAFDDYGDCKQS